MTWPVDDLSFDASPLYERFSFKLYGDIREGCKQKVSLCMHRGNGPLLVATIDSRFWLSGDGVASRPR